MQAVDIFAFVPHSGAHAGRIGRPGCIGMTIGTRSLVRPNLVELNDVSDLYYAEKLLAGWVAGTSAPDSAAGQAAQRVLDRLASKTVNPTVASIPWDGDMAVVWLAAAANLHAAGTTANGVIQPTIAGLCTVFTAASERNAQWKAAQQSNYKPGQIWDKAQHVWVPAPSQVVPDAVAYFQGLDCGPGTTLTPYKSPSVFFPIDFTNQNSVQPANGGSGANTQVNWPSSQEAASGQEPSRNPDGTQVDLSPKTSSSDSSIGVVLIGLAIGIGVLGVAFSGAR